MTDKTEKKTPAATLGEASGLVPMTQLKEREKVHADELKAVQKALEEESRVRGRLEAQVAALKSVLADRDASIATTDKRISEMTAIRDLAVKETCNVKTELLRLQKKMGQ